jgi:hypothetical protein
MVNKLKNELDRVEDTEKKKRLQEVLKYYELF